MVATIQTDWMGISVTLLILLAIILFVWAKIQGDRVVDVLAQIRDLMSGEI